MRGLSRRPAQAQGAVPVEGDVPVVQGDVVSGAGLQQCARRDRRRLFLIHSMEPSIEAVRRARTRRPRRTSPARRAPRAERVVYLGGPIPSARPGLRPPREPAGCRADPDGSSAVLAALRASIVIGAGSRSFRFLVRLVERLPVLAVPAWRTRGQRRSTSATWSSCSLAPRRATRSAGQSLDAGGPDIVSYGELIDRIRDHMFVGRPTVGFRRLTVTPIASRVSAVIAGEDPRADRPADGEPRRGPAAARRPRGRAAGCSTALARRRDRARAARMGGDRAAGRR